MLTSAWNALEKELLCHKGMMSSLVFWWAYLAVSCAWPAMPEWGWQSYKAMILPNPLVHDRNCWQLLQLAVFKGRPTIINNAFCNPTIMATHPYYSAENPVESRKRKSLWEVNQTETFSNRPLKTKFGLWHQICSAKSAQWIHIKQAAAAKTPFHTLVLLRPTFSRPTSSLDSRWYSETWLVNWWAHGVAERHVGRGTVCSPTRLLKLRKVKNWINSYFCQDYTASTFVILTSSVWPWKSPSWQAALKKLISVSAGRSNSLWCLTKHRMAFLFALTALDFSNRRLAELGKHLWRSSCPNPCSSRATQSWLPRTMSRQVLSISKNRDSTTSPGNLSQFWVTLTVKKCFLMFRRNLLHSSLPFELSVCLWTAIKIGAMLGIKIRQEHMLKCWTVIKKKWSDSWAALHSELSEDWS